MYMYIYKVKLRIHNEGVTSLSPSTTNGRTPTHIPAHTHHSKSVSSYT